jgi:nondiscriminating aspartyl-tRNA synthetase
MMLGLWSKSIKMTRLEEEIMERIYGAELSKYVGQKVKVAGWVHNLRKLGKVNFLTVRDVSGIFQVFLTKSESTQLEGLLPESVIEVIGNVIAEPQASVGY